MTPRHFIFLLSSALLLNAYDLPDRRKDQFLSEKGYLVIPAPYSMPGIGEGYVLYGGLNNYLGNTDLFAMKTNGDAEGELLGAWDVHVIPRTLFFDITYLNFSKTGINSYASRGMDSGKDDYSVAVFDSMESLSVDSTLSFWERRLEVQLSHYRQSVRMTSLKNPDGSLLAEFADPQTRFSSNWNIQMLLDLTDDRQDPREGIRFYMQGYRANPDTRFDPDYYTLTWNTTAYIPVFNQSTLALHYQRSDAYITREGEVDFNAVAAELGYDCSLGCSSAIENEIHNRMAYNRYGNATSLGGEGALRSYPGDRFTGAHSQLLGAELRFNFSAEREPIDIFFMKDIRTGLQLAVFHEVATVTDLRRELWDTTRSSSGVGLRLIMGSGFVYRFDYASGDEGGEMTIFVSYPWEGW